METPQSLPELKRKFVNLSNMFVQELADGVSLHELQPLKIEIDSLVEEINRLEKASKKLSYESSVA
jgi:hypothetical protein